MDDNISTLWRCLADLRKGLVALEGCIRKMERGELEKDESASPKRFRFQGHLIAPNTLDTRCGPVTWPTGTPVDVVVMATTIREALTTALKKVPEVKPEDYVVTVDCPSTGEKQSFSPDKWKAYVRGYNELNEMVGIGGSGEPEPFSELVKDMPPRDYND